jgi:hypothetical protein
VRSLPSSSAGELSCSWGRVGRAWRRQLPGASRGGSGASMRPAVAGSWPCSGRTALLRLAWFGLLVVQSNIIPGARAREGLTADADYIDGVKIQIIPAKTSAVARRQQLAESDSGIAVSRSSDESVRLRDIVASVSVNCHSRSLGGRGAVWAPGRSVNCWTWSVRENTFD